MSSESLIKIANAIKALIKSLEENKKLKPEEFPEYSSLPVCIVEDVFSLRTKHKVTDKIVKRFEEWVRKNRNEIYGYKVSDFIEDFEALEGDDTLEKAAFLANAIEAKQKTSGNKPHLKTEVIYEFAKFLDALNIQTKEDLRNYPNEKLLKVVIKGVFGVNDAGYYYIRMLTGDKNKCKPDIHLLNFIDMAMYKNDIKGFSKEKITGEDCQKIFAMVLDSVNDRYENVRHLDYSIWQNREKWSK